MNINKTIKELTDRLDEVHPYSAFINNDQNRNDGINYWKGKKIISTKAWNELYEKNSAYTNAYTHTLTSRKPLLYFPDDYNGSISASGIVVNDELKEEVENWNKEYYELLEFRKNPTWGRLKCSNCLLSGSLDDPIFKGIEKVFARIVSNICNDNNVFNNYSNGIITYHCNVMNIFSCPFESKEEPHNENEEIESKYPYKREDLFALHELSFAIEQAITTFSEMTKNNEIIFEVDFENDRVHEIHTNYYGESESWGWQENIKKQLSKVKPISNIVIRDEQDIYNILTNREKLETLIEEYEKQLLLDKESEEEEELENKINNGNLKPILTIQQKEEFKKHKEEQLVLLKENRQNIIDFLLDNKDLIKVEDLKIYEPVYKCYREKGNCDICNTFTNIICVSCNTHNYNNKEVWLCTNHWRQHRIDNHDQ